MFKTKQFNICLQLICVTFFLLQFKFDWIDSGSITRNLVPLKTIQGEENIFFANAMEADIDKLRYEDVECLFYSSWD